MWACSATLCPFMVFHVGLSLYETWETANGMDLTNLEQQIEECQIKKTDEPLYESEQ